MADAYLRMIYNLELSDRDLRLVCLGLAGKLTRQEDIKAARELNINLLKAQSIRIQEQAIKIDGALRRFQEIQEETPPENTT
jgi:hypothetical protein